MQSGTETTVWQLAPGEVRVMSGAMGFEVQCLEGCVWLTQYGDNRDVVLEAGCSVLPNLSSVVTLSSSRGARIALHRATPVQQKTRGVLNWLASVFSPRAGSAVMRQLEGRLPVVRTTGGEHS